MGTVGEWFGAVILVLAVLIAWDWFESIDRTPCEKVWHGQTYGCKR